MTTDPLVDKIDDLMKRTKQTINDRTKAWDQSAIGKLHKDISIVQRFGFQVIRSLNWLWKWIGSPIHSFFMTAFKNIFFWYVDFWNATVFSKDEYGKESFSIVRGGLMIVATIAVLYALILLGHLSGIAILVLTSSVLKFLKNKSIAVRSSFMAVSLVCVMFSELIFDAFILYPLTSNYHVVYTKGLHEIDTDHNSGTHDVFSTGGCDDKPNCSEQDTSTYRIRPLAFNTLYSIFKHGSLFYPDYVARAIPQETSKCFIHSWGWRQKIVGRNIYRSWDMYADILEAQCVSVDKAL